MLHGHKYQLSDHMIFKYGIASVYTGVLLGKRYKNT